ncbi:MAG TPA: zinc carboxypeptidase, partial [Phnomibacter sp.]|nr:zinc carboxypeptidase [Phnomibacter sp.]
GGRLLTLENATATLARADWGLTEKKTEDEKAKPDDYKLLRKYADRERDYLVYNNPGSIYRIELDNTHPLAFGYPNTYFTLKSDDAVYEFMKEGWNVGVVKKGGAVAGFAGKEVKKKLVDGTLFGALPLGRGQILFMADDVLFRNFWENGKLMVANALFMTGR